MPGDGRVGERRPRARCDSTAGSTVDAPTSTASRPASAATRSCAPRSCGSTRVDGAGAGGRPERRGHGRELALPRHRDPDRRRAAGDVPDDGARARTPTRRSASGSRAAARGDAVAGRRSTCTWSASPTASGATPTRGARPEAATSDQQLEADGDPAEEARDRERAGQGTRRPLLVARGGAGGLALAACGGGSGIEGGGDTGERHDRQAAEASRATLTISNWPVYIDQKHDRARLREGRPASRSSTSRTSTTTTSSSARCSRSSTRASRAAASIFVVTDWMAKQDVRPRLPPGPRQVGDPERRWRTCVPSLQQPDVRPRTASSRCRGRAG